MNTIDSVGDFNAFKSIVEGTITSYTDDELLTIEQYGLASKLQITEIDLPNVKSVGQGAFAYSSKLNNFNLPSLETVASLAFSNTAATELSLPSAITLEDSALANMEKLTNVNLPMVKVVNSSVFSGCKRLTKLTLPSATTFKRKPFGYNNYITELTVPEASILSEYAFSDLHKLSKLVLPKAESIPGYAFDSSSMSIIDLPSVTKFKRYWDANLHNGVTIIIRQSSSVVAQPTALPAGHIAAVYVPDNLTDDYKAATNWSAISDKIYPLSELPEDE